MSLLKAAFPWGPWESPQVKCRSNCQIISSLHNYCRASISILCPEGSVNKCPRLQLSWFPIHQKAQVMCSLKRFFLRNGYCQGELPAGSSTSRAASPALGWCRSDQCWHITALGTSSRISAPCNQNGAFVKEKIRPF